MPSLLIDIEARISKLADTLELAQRQILGFKRKAESALEGVGKISFGIIGADTLERAFDWLKESFKDGVEKAKEMQREMLQLGAVLKTTGMSAGFTGEQINQMIESLSKRTIIDDGEIRRAATALLRFRSIQGDVFREALELGPDLARTLGTDMVSAVQKLAKALQGSGTELKGLKESGIELSQSEIDMAGRFAEVGNKAGVARIVFDALKRSIGGTAGAETQGLYGATKQFESAWDDLKKTIGGRFLESNEQSMRRFTGWLKEATEGVKGLDLSLEKMVSAIGRNVMGALPQLRPIMNLLEMLDKVDQKTKGRQEVSGKIKGRFGNLPLEEEEAMRAELRAKISEDVDQEKLRRREFSERQAADAEKSARVRLQQKRAILDAEETMDAYAYKQGLKSLEDYYDSQETIVTRGLADQLAELGEQGKKAEAAFAASAQQRADVFTLNSRLQDIATQSDQAAYQAGNKLAQLRLARAEAADTEADALKRVTAALYEQNGELVKAAEIRQAIENRKLERLAPKSATAAEQLAAQQLVDRRTNAELRMQEIRSQDEVILDRLHSEEESLNALREAGSITEIERMREVDLARLRVVDTLKRHAAELREVAAREGDVTGKLQAQAEAADAAAKSLEASIGGLEKAFKDIGEGAMQQFFEDFASGTKSAKTLFDDLVRAITAGISRIAAANVSQKLFEKDSWFEKAAGWLAGLFSGTGSTSGYLASSSIPIEQRAFGAAYDRGHEITRFGDGGVVTSPRFFRAAHGIGLMGEAGPEAILPLQRGPSGKLGVRGGGGVNITMNISTPDVKSFAQSQGQMAKKAALAISGARRNL